MCLSHLVDSLWRSGKRTLITLALTASYAMPALPSMSCDFTVPNHASPDHASSDDTEAPDCVEGDFLVTESGVRITWAIESGMFPKDFPEDTNATPLCWQEDVNQIVTAVLNGLAKYPDSVLAPNLKTVYLVERLKMDDTPVGGTVDPSTQRIYIVAGSPYSADRSCILERTFHHEFSSILAYWHSWNFSRWEAVNPKGFTYGNDPFEAIREGRTSSELDSQLAEDGFLTSYSMTSVENDFSMYAEYHFFPEPLLWEIVDAYPRVQRKSSLMVEFYNSLNQQYTGTFFRNLGLCGK